MGDIHTLHRILRDNRRIAIVGLSASWHRPSFFAAKYLIEQGYEVVPVNPRYDEILGCRCYPDLYAIPGKIDVVDCFRRAEDIPPSGPGSHRYRRQGIVDAARCYQY